MEEKSLWKRAAEKNKRSLNQEKSLANDSNGKRQINSGRLWHSKRDVKRWGYLIEARDVGHNAKGEAVKSYSVKADELHEIEKAAYFHNALPAMQINFAKTQRRYMIVRLQDWEETQSRFETLEEQVRELELLVQELKNELDDE